MTWSKQIVAALRNLLRNERVERELDAEVGAYLDQLTEEKMAAGMTPQEAHRAARIEMGGVEQVKLQVRETRAGALVEQLVQDVRYGLRTLRKAPGFTAVAVLTLALGIGAVTAIFSAIHPILIEPLPYPQAGRIMMIWDFGVDGSRLDVTFGTYRELVERSRSFEALAVLRSWQPAMTGAAEPERFDGQLVSSAYFRVLGVPPVLGRDFDPSDDRLHGPKVVILSDKLWQRRFGRDPTMIGRPITLDEESYTVIGVLPSAFENVLAPSAELWTLLQYDMSQDRAWGHHLRLVGRLRFSAGTDQGQRELNAIAGAPVQEFPRRPWASLGSGLIVNSLQDDITSAVRPALLAILIAASLVLLITCVNVTNLLLARGAQRRGEFTVRAALGAARARLIRQQLTESLLLAGAGGLAGIAAATLGVRALVALSPAGLPRVGAIQLDADVLAFALGLTTLIGLAVGLVPALHASRGNLQNSLQQTSRRTVGSHQFTRRTLVAAEVALALVLLVSAGLLLRSLQRLFAVDPGFDGSHLLTMQVQTSGRRFDKNTTQQFFARALEAVRQVPGVTAAALTSQLPLSGDYNEYGVSFESSPEGTSGGGLPAFRYAVSPGYVEVMRIPLRRGRLLGTQDGAGAPQAALISELVAKKFPKGDPIGQRIHVGPTDRPPYTIVGVVGDVKQTSLAESRADAVYITTEQWPFADNALWLMVRTQRDVTALAPAIRKAIWAVDKDQPIVRVSTMDDLLTASAAERRFALILFESFALAALVLAAAGIYGVLAYAVAQRTQEIGVRIALGAQKGDVLRLVIGQGMTPALVGLALGVGGAVGLTRLLATQLFGVTPTDPFTFALAGVVLAGVALLACYLPARRATKVDPIVALRYE